MNVREAVFDLLREQGMTTIFGNPGSTELPMLQDYPDDFKYVLGLQEIVAVGMADGFAQASGRPAHVNLHTAPGVGNGMGAIFNARANKAALLVTAGQQARSLMTLEANLTNRKLRKDRLSGKKILGVDKYRLDPLTTNFRLQLI